MVQDSYRVGLIGSGIGPSLSPALHEREAQRQGLRYRYELFDLDALDQPPEHVGELLRDARRSGFAGVNVTHPCKQRVLAQLDALSPQAEVLGAVNTVVFGADGRAVGHNTDVTGFAAAFRRGLPDAALRYVVQLGAGGAGAAVAHALLTLGTQRITVVDPVRERARQLAESLDRHAGHHLAHTPADATNPVRAQASSCAQLEAALAHADGLVHATPTGMADRPGLPLPARLLRPELWVAEVVYRPLETELVHAARAAGCRVLNGGGMAVFQAADAFRLFTGRPADSAGMLADFAELTTAQPQL